MPSVGSGGSLVTGANIVDGTVSNADIATNAAIAQSKIAGLIGNPGTLISIEQTVNTTAAVTTLANQAILVIAKGTVTGLATAGSQVTLSYNGVQKDICNYRHPGASDEADNFCLTALFTPGADTQNLVVAASTTLTNCVITVIKLQIG